MQDLGISWDGRGSDTVEIFRPVEEVSHPRFLASLRGLSITLRHPASFVSPSTHSLYDVGTVLDPEVVKVAAGVIITANLMVKAQRALDSIAAGLTRQISLAYDYDLTEEGGKLVARHLVANHCALVEMARMNRDRGRFPFAQLQDSAGVKSTDDRIDAILADVKKVRDTVENASDRELIRAYVARNARASDALPYKADRGTTSFDDLASELGKDAADGSNYGQKITSAFLGKPIIVGLDDYRHQQTTRPDRRASDSADERAAEDFSAMCAAHLGEEAR